MHGNHLPSASLSDPMPTLVMRLAGSEPGGDGVGDGGAVGASDGAGVADCLVRSFSGAGLDGTDLTSLLSSTSWSFHNLSQH